MTRSELADRIEKAEGPVPAKAEFSCGAYSDGSGYEVTIGYDTESEHFGRHILIDEYNVSFRHEHAEEVIAAIRYCAAALRAQDASHD